MNWVLVAPIGLFAIALIGGLIGGLKIVFYLGKLHERLVGIEAEFHPDHGSSLKDDVNTMKGNLRDLGTKFDAHLMQHAGAWR